MTNFIILQESMTNGYKAEFLFILSLICIFSGISIIITKNPILSVLFLIALFFTIAIYLMMLGFYFIGLSYLLVYVGAVSILFLFILMLINVRISELLTEGRNSIPLAILAIISFNFSVETALPYSIYLLDNGLQPLFNFVNNLFTKIFTPLNRAFFSDTELGLANLIRENNLYSNSSNKIANISSKSWDSLLMETTHITSIGNTLYSNLFILLIVTSFILLLAMVGSIVITVKDKKYNRSEYIALTSGLSFPKGIINSLSVILTLAMLGFMLKYPIAICSHLLDTHWVYVLFCITLIYPLWLVKFYFSNEKGKFTLTIFLISTLTIVLVGYFAHTGHISFVYLSLFNFLLTFSPFSVGKNIALNYYPHNLIEFLFTETGALPVGGEAGKTATPAAPSAAPAVPGPLQDTAGIVPTGPSSTGLIVGYDMSDDTRTKPTLYDGVSRPPRKYKLLFDDSIKKLKEHSSIGFWGHFNDMRGAWCDQAILSGNIARLKYQEGLNNGLNSISLESKFNTAKSNIIFNLEYELHRISFAEFSIGKLWHGNHYDNLNHKLVVDQANVVRVREVQNKLNSL